MMARLSRILVTALLGALVGLGVIMAVFGGRRPRIPGTAQTSGTTRAEGMVQVAVPSLPSRKRRAQLSLAVGLVGLLLMTGLAGILYASRDILFGPGSPTNDGVGKPLAAVLPGDTDGGRSSAPKTDAPPGNRSAPEQGGQASPSPSESAAPPVPGFDVVRVEPNGEAVIAGRAAANSTIKLLVDGRSAATARTDADGHFTFTPPPLPTGSSEVGLRATDARGHEWHSSANLAVVVAPSRNARPIETARIVRGDNLWRISRRTYGEGERYTLIFDANQDQIRDPDLIYPGQILVLPSRDAFGAQGEGRRE